MEKPTEFDVMPTAKFESDVVFYMKKKKYTHIIDDIKTVKVELEQGNFIGEEIPNLKLESGGHTYKVRAANTDMKVGKSNGYRIIYYVIMDNKVVYLLTIYSKKDDDKVLSNKEIVELIAKYCL
ncbi:MAG: hypothetical protein K2F89_08240 [Treponemataceae bacterium]|nr:hypothetical protein [Treponemataceae bacterium]